MKTNICILTVVVLVLLCGCQKHSRNLAEVKPLKDQPAYTQPADAQRNPAVGPSAFGTY